MSTLAGAIVRESLMMMIFVRTVTLVSHGADETCQVFQFTTPIRTIIRERSRPATTSADRREKQI